MLKNENTRPVNWDQLFISIIVVLVIQYKTREGYLNSGIIISDTSFNFVQLHKYDGYWRNNWRWRVHTSFSYRATCVVVIEPIPINHKDV